MLVAVACPCGAPVSDGGAAYPIAFSENVFRGPCWSSQGNQLLVLLEVMDSALEGAVRCARMSRGPPCVSCVSDVLMAFVLVVVESGGGSIQKTQRRNARL